MEFLDGAGVVQNRYAGDIGDFSKFMLLKHVIGSSFGNAGIVWYAHPNEGHNNDGRHIKYLDKQEYRKSDPHLVDRLRNMVNHPESKDKGISLLESCVFDPLVQSFAEIVPEIKEARSRWILEALNRMGECPVVMLDPDNGLRPEKNISAESSKIRSRTGSLPVFSEIKDTCPLSAFSPKRNP